MDAEGITKLYAGMKLTEEEGEAITIQGSVKEDGMKKFLICLVGKLLTAKLPNRDAFRSLIARIWRTAHPVEVENVRNNIFAFYFHNLIDRKRVLIGGPWNFDNALLVLEAPNGYGDFAEMEFRWSEFWIQVHNVPLICMTKVVGLLIEEKIRGVKDIDAGASGDCFGKFLRVRVVVDTTGPLKRAVRITIEGMEEVKTLLLKYERLPEYCFHCGLLGHAYKECPKDNEVANSISNREFNFESWMRASSPIKTRPGGPKNNQPGVSSSD
ncbi:hypothetical protein ACOSP7_004947 [Xanthoceras sorbifolium]